MLSPSCAKQKSEQNNVTQQDEAQIDERSLRKALSHLVRWHFIGAALSLVLAFIPAYLVASILPEVGPVRRAVLGFFDLLPFMTTPGRIEVALFVTGTILLLIFTNIGTGIASDIVRWRIINRINDQANPVALAEAMKNRLRARSGRLEQQYRFFPKHSENGKLLPHGLYVGIGTMAPFWLLIVFFFFYFRW